MRVVVEGASYDARTHVLGVSERAEIRLKATTGIEPV
jgi:hypothetical protein